VHLLLIADAFPPMRISAAVHMHELAVELHRQGHQVTVLIPVEGINKNVHAEDFPLYRLIRVGGLKTKDVSHVKRVLAEFINPFIIFWRIKGINALPTTLNGVIWYSPSIFFGPLIRKLVKKYRCPSYLILRDLFPRWALDLGLINRGMSYFILRCIEEYQYKVADIIGIQSPGNRIFFKQFSSRIQSKIEVLWPWVSSVPLVPCSIDVSKTILADRKIFLYAGNMGMAQNLQSILDLATYFKDRSDLGFLFVGRGDDSERLKNVALRNGLSNVLFYPEIHPIEIPALSLQCVAGIVSLDIRHKTHNIPGKFLSYMKFCLPVLAKLNPGNDLVDLISQNSVGVTVTTNNELDLIGATKNLLNMLATDKEIFKRCQDFAQEKFSTEKAAKQIVGALNASVNVPTQTT
jgi:glycosyltransferase involved in cell wall biosynthesis